MAGTGLLISAAGDSKRMGRPKLLLPLGNRFAWERLHEIGHAAGCRWTCLLCAEALRHHLPVGGPDLRIAFVPEELRRRGPIGSLVHGLSCLPDELDGVLIWPVDHPFVRESTVRRLLAGQGRVRLPEQDGRGGHPVWIERELFERLPEQLEHGSLRTLIATVPPEAIERIPVDDFGVRFNCNTPADFDAGLVRWQRDSR